MTATETVLDRRQQAFLEQDVARTVACYARDAVIVTNMGTFRRHEGIERLFDDLFEEFAQRVSMSTTRRSKGRLHTSCGAAKRRRTSTSSRQRPSTSPTTKSSSRASLSTSLRNLKRKRSTVRDSHRSGSTPEKPNSSPTFGRVVGQLGDSANCSIRALQIYNTRPD